MRRSLSSLAALLALGFALFFGGAGGAGTLPWIGTFALVLAAALLPVPRLTRAGWIAVVLFAAFVVWCGLSTAWSWLPDRSWEYLNRGLVYGAFLVLGLALAAEARELALGSAALLGAVVVWSLAGKVFPWLGDNGRVARLRDPVGIWNELALLGDLALPLGLWIATEVRRRPGLLLVYGWSVAILLTLSRGGAIVAVAVCALWTVFAARRFESLVALVVAALPAVVVAAIAFALPGVTSNGQPHSTRVRDGLVFGAALLVGAALVALVPELAPEERRRRTVRRALAVGGALATVVLLAVAATHASSWWDEFRNPASVEASNEPGRLGSASSNNRWRWWGEAVDGWRLKKLEGTGAGSFEVVHKRFRGNDQAVTEPHDLPVQFLAETGVVGLLLWAGAFAAALFALFRRPPRSARLALALAPVAFVLHGLLEIDWDFLAVCAPVFLALGAALGGPAPRAPVAWRLAAGAVALAGAVSLFSPWLADRYVNRAYDRLGSTAAVRAADRARALDPLSLDPLLARANAKLALRDLRGAYADHLAEVAEQPENPDAWCDLGQFELDVLHLPSRAYEHLNRWYTLDSQGPCLDLLDRARRAVNAGG
jgi:O-Antigen ligase